MKRILYLPGLNSSLYSDRRNVLEKYNIKIIAPQTDYEGNPNLWKELLALENIDAVVGSSAGGLVGYYLSGFKQIPALLFNPALPFRHYFPDLPTLPVREEYLQIILGANDTDVPADQTFEFLQKEFDTNAPVEIHWINNLAHLFSIEIFDRELAFFMQRLGFD